MSRHSYSSTERRGVIAIALVALIIIALGIGFSYFRGESGQKEKPRITEMTEFLDTLNNDIDKPEISSNSAAEKTRKKTNSTSKKSKTKKTYRKRNPLDEPI